MHRVVGPQQSQLVPQDPPTGLQQTTLPACGQKLSSQMAPVVLVQHWALLEQATWRPTNEHGIHAPFSQVPPPLQGVPKAFALILPALQDFFPFLRSHLPRLQVSHSPGWRLHLVDLAASAASGSVSLRTLRVPPRAAVTAWRRGVGGG